MCRESRAFLPGNDLAAMIPGEEDGAVRFKELFVRAVVVSRTPCCGGSAADPRPKVKRNLAPVHVHGLAELPAAAGMQSLDRGAGCVQLGLNIGQGCERRPSFYAIAGDQHAGLA